MPVIRIPLTPAQAAHLTQLANAADLASRASQAALTQAALAQCTTKDVARMASMFVTTDALECTLPDVEAPT